MRPTTKHCTAYCRRRPLRLVWFGFGAGAATAMIKHKELADCREKAYWKHCQRPPVRENLAQSKLAVWRRQYEGYESGDGSGHGMGNGSRKVAGEEEWVQQEREKVVRCGRQVKDAVTDLTEATLDSLLDTCAALKQKFVHQRKQRERDLHVQRLSGDPASHDKHL